MIQYEVVEFYYGEWGGSCGVFDQLHDAMNIAFQDGFEQGELNVLRQFVEGVK